MVPTASMHGNVMNYHPVSAPTVQSFPTAVQQAQAQFSSVPAAAASNAFIAQESRSSANFYVTPRLPVVSAPVVVQQPAPAPVRMLNAVAAQPPHNAVVISVGQSIVPTSSVCNVMQQPAAGLNAAAMAAAPGSARAAAPVMTPALHMPVLAVPQMIRAASNVNQGEMMSQF